MRPGTPGFIRHRLVEAREARAMTALSLAEVVGVSRAAISQYENGHQSPSPDVLRRLSTALNVPAHRFIKPIQPRESGVCFYRCMATATKRARDRAQRRYDWLREGCQYIERFVKFRQVSLPKFDVPSDPSKLSLEHVEELAVETRNAFRLAPDEPVGSVVGLLETHGAIVSRFDLEAVTLDAFSEWAVGDPRPFVILSSGRNSAVRSRFDAAHELGHMLLHRQISRAAFNQNDSFSLIESQAHRFAGAFLLPASAFAESFYAPTLDALRSMKERWRVAIAAMIMRASGLGLIDGEQSKRMWMNMGRRKWRMREPLDDTLPIEQPQYLRRCMELLLERRMIGPSDISAQLGLPTMDVEQLMGLPRGALSGHAMAIEFAGDDTPPQTGPDMPDVIPFRKRTVTIPT